MAKKPTGEWEPVGEFTRIHGDCKSTTGGKYHIEIMKSTEGKYIAKIVGAPDNSPVEIDDENATVEPSMARVASVLKAKFGGKFGGTSKK